MFFAIGSSMGSIIAALCIDNKKSFLCIGLASILPAIIIIINLFGSGETQLSKEKSLDESSLII